MKSVLLVLSSLAFVSANKTLVNKCCAKGEVLIEDECENQVDVKLLHSWPIYNSFGASNQVTPDQLQLNFTQCRVGFRVIAKKFKAFENGTLETDYGLMVDDFCLNEDSSGSLVARYCSVEPCANCVKKCCPNNMLYVEGPNQGLCQLSKHRAPDLSSVIGNATNIIESAKPVCSHEMYRMNSQEFSIESDGTLFEPTDDMNYTNKHYCIENSIKISKVNDSSSVQEEVIALLCFPGDHYEDDKIVLSIFPYLLFVSSIFLIATFIVYLVLPELRNVHGLAIMCYTVSLSTFFIGMGTIQLKSNFDDGTCIFLACTVHFGILSSFTWPNVMSLDIWLTLKNVRQRKSLHGRRAFGRRFVYFSVYAWGLPLLIVSTGQIIQKLHGFNGDVIAPSFGKDTCWFPLKQARALWLYLYGPIGALILVNLLFFLLTIRMLCQANADNVFAKNRARNKQKFRVMLSLLILMGITWITEVVSGVVGGSVYIWMIFDVVNILTGLFIFLLFVCKPNVWKLLKQRFPKLARLDPCCPKFMNKRGDCSSVRSANHDRKQKLSEANSNASNKSVSMQTFVTTDGASKLPSAIAKEQSS